MEEQERGEKMKERRGRIVGSAEKEIIGGREKNSKRSEKNRG